MNYVMAPGAYGHIFWKFMEFYRYYRNLIATEEIDEEKDYYSHDEDEDRNNSIDNSGRDDDNNKSEGTDNDSKTTEFRKKKFTLSTSPTKVFSV